MADAICSTSTRKRKRSQADKLRLTQDDLKAKLHYDPETGVFTWVLTHVHRVGLRAGSAKSGGRRYRVINIGGVLYREHRLAWFYMTGEWPVTDVDHKNRIRDDNRWVNLRLATRAQNNANSVVPKNNTSGAKGVVFDSRYREPWKAQMSIANKTVVIGRFSTMEAASQAYQAEMRRCFGEFAA